MAGSLWARRNIRNGKMLGSPILWTFKQKIIEKSLLVALRIPEKCGRICPEVRTNVLFLPRGKEGKEKKRQIRRRPRRHSAKLMVPGVSNRAAERNGVCSLQRQRGWRSYSNIPYKPETRSAGVFLGVPGANLFTKRGPGEKEQI